MRLGSVAIGRAVIVTTVVAALAWPALASAVEIKDLKATEDAKKIVLRFDFSEPAKADVIYHYAGNFVGLRVAGLHFSKGQLKADVQPASADAGLAYRYVRYIQEQDGGVARIYLQKPLTPADAQVVPYEDHVEVTLLKPAVGNANEVETPPSDAPNFEQKPPQKPSEPAQPAAEPQPVHEQPADSATPADSSTPPGSFRPSRGNNETEPAAPSGDSTAGQSQLTDNGGATTPQDQPVDNGAAPPAASDSGAKVGGKPYTQFNLNDVPVNQPVIKSLPFREALMQIVSGSGFNVVVGDDVDNVEVSLNFTQKQISLKSALDLLSIAYDLIYTVEPDAIVIRAKK